MLTIGERTLAFIELLHHPSLNHPEPVWLNANQTKTETSSVHSVDTYSKPKSIANLHLPREVQAAAHEIATAPGATPDAAPSATRQDRGPFRCEVSVRPLQKPVPCHSEIGEGEQRVQLSRVWAPMED